MNVQGHPRRSRERIGADAARVWARELDLGNPYAKAILLAVANYMNEDGIAWPGLVTISRDTDISEETVAKRLRWLESIGAIVLFKTWLDENGRRNQNGRGKPTSSEIRFLFDADADEISQAAKEGTESKPLRGAALQSHEQKSEVSTRPRGELNTEVQHPVSTQPAPEQPPPASDCSIEGNLEQEEDPPNPPLGGDRAQVDQDFEDDIAEFIREYPDSITHLPQLRNVLAAMDKAERRKVVTAVRGYAEHIRGWERRGRPKSVKGAHLWVANGLWQGYVPAGEKAVTAALMQRVAVNSDAGKAWAVLHKIAHVTPLEGAGHFILPRPLSPQGMAFAHAPPESDWVFIGSDQINQCGAWRSLLADVMAGVSRPELVWERGGKRGFLAPWPWPPRKDGGTGPPSEVA
jgi:hypothetical protein